MDKQKWSIYRWFMMISPWKMVDFPVRDAAASWDPGVPGLDQSARRSLWGEREKCSDSQGESDLLVHLVQILGNSHIVYFFIVIYIYIDII